MFLSYGRNRITVEKIGGGVQHSGKHVKQYQRPSTPYSLHLCPISAQFLQTDVNINY